MEQYDKRGSYAGAKQQHIPLEEAEKPLMRGEEWSSTRYIPQRVSMDDQSRLERAKSLFSQLQQLKCDPFTKQEFYHGHA